MDAILNEIITKTHGGLGKTLSLVISKSGGTAETRNGMLEAQSAYESSGIDFGPHAVAITGDGSKLFNYATANNFLTDLSDGRLGRRAHLSDVHRGPHSCSTPTH